MTQADFVHLRVHSAFSLLEGALRIGEIVDLCKMHEMPAVAITDSGNLFGALEFSQSCAKAGVQPIIGCEIAVAATDAERRNGGGPILDKLLLYAQNKTGYRNLLKLVSRSFLETPTGYDPHVSYSDVQELAGGLIALTGGLKGALGRHLMGGQTAAAKAALAELNEIFPGNLYIEIARHGVPDEIKIEEGLIDLAMRENLPLVATNEAFFAEAGMFEAHDALLCVANSTYVSEADRPRLNPQYRFKSPQEMKADFADLPEAIENTLVIAQRCSVMAEAIDPILPGYEISSGLSEAEHLYNEAQGGLEDRLKAAVFTDEMSDAEKEEVAKPYRERLSFELDVIKSMGFPGYFLIVADFIKWAKSKGIPVGPGRGSGAGSVAAWALTITDLDPLRWGLLFERFLNPERISMPDFDIDFCQERRDEVIRYVQEKYGADKVAQIITFGKLQARAVLRDVGRVLQVPYGQVDRICKLVPNNPADPVTLGQAIEMEPQLQDMRRTDETVGRLIDMSLKLEGLYRHASTHAAGVVIGDRPLDELVPLYRDPRSDMPVTQFNMKDVEKAGLVKFDFLGLKTLSVLALAVKMLKERDIEVDLELLPLDDPGVYEMMSRGETTGVFQFESGGMRSLLREARVGTFEDIIALVALYRPGPMENIPKYIACKHGKEEPEFLHETIVPVVKDTYGVIIYQEQVMQIAQVFAGYSLGQADILRKAMGKKIKAEMDAQRDTFVEGAMEKEVTKDRASYVFDLVDKFAGYGFNKAHSAGYALVAYQTAYLKSNHPVEFLAASMTFDIGNADRLTGYRRELQRMDVPLLTPDVNASQANFSVENGSIRYALAALKNVGEAAMETLVVEREENGPFKDVADFASRLGNSVINRRQLENLIKSGAMDKLNPNRRQMCEGIDAILALATAAAGDRESNQTNLFGEAESTNVAIRLPDVPDWPIMDRLRNEFDAVGLYLSSHPLDSYEKSLEKVGVSTYADLLQKAGAGQLPTLSKMAGTVINKKERRSSRTGNKFAFIQLSDASGVYEISVFTEQLAASREMIDEAIESGAPILISGSLRMEGDELKIRAEGIKLLDNVVAQTAVGLRVYLNGPDAIGPLHALIERERSGRGQIHLVVPSDGCETHIRLQDKLMVSPAMRAAVKSIPGILHVEEV